MLLIEVVVNGDVAMIEPSTSVAAVLDQRGFNPRYAAVAVNEQFLPRAQHHALLLQPGDRIEVLMPFAGG